MRRCSAAFLAFVVTGAAACADGPGGGDGTWVATTDTVGDTVVVRTESGSVWGADARLVEELRIGVVEGEEAYTFGRIGTVAADPDGRIYVVDEQVPAVRMYQADGTHLADVGARGGGPGEYERPRGVVFLPGGDWAVYDDRTRINVYDASGAFRTSVPVSSRYSTGGPHFPLYADSAGGVYYPDRAEIAGERRSVLVRVPVAGGVADTVVEPVVPGLPGPIAVPIEGGAMTVAPPLAPSVTWLVDRSGRRVYGTGAEYAITLEEDAGARRIEREAAPVRLSDAERRESEETFFANVRSMAPDFRWDGAYPAEKPFFWKLLTAADGRFWVRLHLPSERREIPPPASAEPGTPPRVTWYEPQRWDVFEPDGRYLGAVDMPDDFTFHFAMGQHVWGVTRDELGVNFVVRMRIEPMQP